MNLTPDPESPWLARLSQLPRPILREEARQRSMAAALASLDERRTLPPPRQGRFRRLVTIHTAGWAACWITIVWFQLQAPPPGPRSEAPPLSAWPSPPADPEMARLMASLYPQRLPGGMPPSSTADFPWIHQP